jgi:hypothetical protein
MSQAVLTTGGVTVTDPQETCTICVCLSASTSLGRYTFLVSPWPSLWYWPSPHVYSWRESTTRQRSAPWLAHNGITTCWHDIK